MKKRTFSRSGLLLTEIILAILFFSIASAVCLQLFVKARTFGQSTAELDMAVRQASSAAEILGQAEDPFGTLERLYNEATFSKDTAALYFDSDFQPCGQTDSSYCLEILSEPMDERTVVYTVSVLKNSDSAEIYGLEVISYHQYTQPVQKGGSM